MTCNLMNNEAELRSAFEAVSNSQNGNEWAIFEYDANSNIVKLGAIGGGGVDELLESFNSSKVQYGFATVAGNVPAGSSNQTQRKVLLIHWQGAGVPAARLATTASHVEEIRRFVRRVHVTIYARSEEDLERETLAKQLEKVQEIAPNALGRGNVASGQTASSPSAIEPAAVPMVPTSPIPPPPELPEKPLGLEGMVKSEVPNVPNPPPPTPSTPSDAVKAAPLPPAMADAPQVPSPPTSAENPSKELCPSIEQTASSTSAPFIPPCPVGANYQKSAVAQEDLDREEREKFWQEMRDEEETRRREEAERRRQTQEQFAREQKALAEKLHRAHLEQIEGQKQQQQPHLAKSQSLDAGAAITKRGKLIAGRTQLFEQKVAELAEGKPVKKPKNFKWQVNVQGKPTGAPVNQVPEPPPKQFECVMKRKEQPSTQSMGQTVEQTVFNKIPVAPVPPVARLPPQIEEAGQDKQAGVEKLQNGGKQVESKEEPVNGNGPVPLNGVGEEIKAKAIWDYQAEDPTEVSFNPEDVITQIQMIHDGWWYGRAPNGAMGLFPSNYVQLLK